MRTAQRKGRRGSLNLPASVTAMLPPLPTDDMCYSDTSQSTAAEHEFDSSDRRKRRRVKPLPPLPKPIVPHSEVYFTETETESEAPHRTRRQEPLPKLDPPPKLNKDKPKYDRLRPHKPHQHGADPVPPSHPSHRQSLELALTKGAARQFSIPTMHENKVKVMCKKPMARPRSMRPSTSLDEQILVNENVISTATANNNNIKRSQTVPAERQHRGATH